LILFFVQDFAFKGKLIKRVNKYKCNYDKSKTTVPTQLRPLRALSAINNEVSL